MRATAFPYYTPPFAEYNVAQQAVVPFLDKDLNLVVSFATASGKTVLGEACFGFHLQTETDCRVAYVCPFKSLAAEKFQDWKNNPQLNGGGVVLSSTDSDAWVKDHESARVAVVTCESFDAKTRSRAYRNWLGSLACVVWDEVHLINDKSRGGAIESSMMRLTDINPAARIILLSATMGNAMELSKWVKSLNGKQTKCIVSEWRPSRIDMDYVVVADESEKIDEAVRLVSESSGKIIVFVHSKVTGNEILNRLRALKIRCAFHNASKRPKARAKMEELFNDSMSGFNVLVSTSTLGAGVNIG
jgi:replicative superfamily II helicase